MTSPSIFPVNIRYLSLFILLVWMTGCTNITIYRNPLSELSESATRTRVAIETMSQEANRAKVKKLALIAAVESKRFGAPELEELIPPEYLSIRSDGLRMIELLATRLLEVIDSDAGTTVAKGIENVGIKTQTLATSLGNTSLAGYSGPVSSLAGTIVKIYDQNKREEILYIAVNKGIPEAQTVIEILKKDFSPASATDINKVLLEQLDRHVTEKINQYDLLLQYQKNLPEKDKKQPELIKARMAAIEEIIKAQEARDSLNALSLLATLNALSHTLDNLKEVVNSNKNPKQFAVFASQLTEFTARSVELLKAVSTLEKANRSSTD